MAEFAMAPISLEDIHTFYSIDREIFTRLVVNLLRDPAESLLILALWMCLEDMDFPCIVQKIINLPNGMLNGLAEEAISCLMCLDSKSPLQVYPDGSLPLTTVVVGRRIGLSLFYENKFTLVCNIKAFLNNVCANIFTDILMRIFPSRAVYNHPLVIPGFPHPIFGPITVIPRPPGYVFPGNGIWGWSLHVEAPVDDRTIFLTFSRGYPVSEAEVRELFVSHFGDCVESLSMEPSPTAPDQSLYARLVVRNIATIDRILVGGPIAKFKINGKHVWARKFERRDA